MPPLLLTRGGGGGGSGSGYGGSGMFAAGSGDLDSALSGTPRSDDMSSVAGDDADSVWGGGSAAGGNGSGGNGAGGRYAPGAGDNVRVVVRVRPPSATELADPNHYACAATPNTQEIVLALPGGRDAARFAFDEVLPEATGQAEVFEAVGAPAVDNCLSGYNSSVFAYGQTGAGKTFTMTGRGGGGASGAASDLRGLAPRAFEYLFRRVEAMQDAQGRGRLKFSLRCSMLEIYNEVITDLLNPAATNLQIREDIKRGCFVEGLSEEAVQNADDALRVLRRGAENRHVGETRLNRESSRSHLVFTLTIERHSREDPAAAPAEGGGEEGDGDGATSAPPAAAAAAARAASPASGEGSGGDGAAASGAAAAAGAGGAGAGAGGGGQLTKVVFSRLNLIDLAGSERIRGGALGGSGAQGEHFREACHINKSLTTLGRCAPFWPCFGLGRLGAGASSVLYLAAF